MDGIITCQLLDFKKLLLLLFHQGYISGIYFNKFSCVTGWEKRLQQRNKKYKKERMLNNYNEQKVQFKNIRSLRSKASQVRITLICVTVSRRSPKILTRLKQEDQAYRYTNFTDKQLKKMNTHSLWSDLHMLCVWSLIVKVSFFFVLNDRLDPNEMPNPIKYIISIKWAVLHQT